MKYKLIIGLLIICLIIVFSIQNVEVVEINFLIWSFGMSKALVLFTVFVLGVTGGWLLCGWANKKK